VYSVLDDVLTLVLVLTPSLNDAESVTVWFIIPVLETVPESL
jgi:hypothetical protein